MNQSDQILVASPEAFARRCSVKKVFLKISLGLKLYQIRDCSTVVFLWILRSFQQHLYLQKTSGSLYISLLHLTEHVKDITISLFLTTFLDWSIHFNCGFSFWKTSDHLFGFFTHSSFYTKIASLKLLKLPFI